MHEMGEIKRAQEQRIDEVSMQKLREHHETIQQLTSKFQQQEQMNSMNDSGLFHDVESSCSGRLSHVSSQLAMIPSSRPMLSRHKRQPLVTWNQSGLQENVFGNQSSTKDSPQKHSRGNHPCTPQKERESVPEATGSRTLFARDEEQNTGTIPMPTSAGRPWTSSSLYRWSFRRIL